MQGWMYLGTEIDVVTSVGVDVHGQAMQARSADLHEDVLGFRDLHEDVLGFRTDRPCKRAPQTTVIGRLLLSLALPPLPLPEAPEAAGAAGALPVGRA